MSRCHREAPSQTHSLESRSFHTTPIPASVTGSLGTDNEELLEPRGARTPTVGSRFPRALPSASHTPCPPPQLRARPQAVLTQVVRVAEVEGVAAVHVVVQGLLDQVLGLVPRQLGHPKVGGGRSVSYPLCRLPLTSVLTGVANQSEAKGRGGRDAGPGTWE